MRCWKNIQKDPFVESLLSRKPFRSRIRIERKKEGSLSPAHGGTGLSLARGMSHARGHLKHQLIIIITEHAAPTALRSCCFNRVTTLRTMSVALLLRNNSKRKKSNVGSPAPTSLLMISSGPTWRSSSTSLLLISWSFDLAWWWWWWVDA